MHGQGQDAGGLQHPVSAECGAEGIDRGVLAQVVAVDRMYVEDALGRIRVSLRNGSGVDGQPQRVVPGRPVVAQEPRAAEHRRVAVDRRDLVAHPAARVAAAREVTEMGLGRDQRRR
jgi:hypothetical protein